MKKKKILIIGAGEAGIMLLKEFLKRDKGDDICGFVDDDPAKQGKTLNGKPVLSTTGNIVPVLMNHSITEVMVAIPSAPKDFINGLLEQITAYDSTINIFLLPSVERYFETIPLTPSLNDFPFSELFGRRDSTFDIDLIQKHLEGKTVLVTGAGGSIGSEICRQILKFNAGKIIALGKGENSIFNLQRSLNEYLSLMERSPEIEYRIADVRDRSSIASILAGTRTDCIIHAAAHKHVTLMEHNEAEAVRNNVFGTLSLLDAATEQGCGQFLLISTDKAVRPTSIMGATKRIAELLVLKYHLEKSMNASIVRFGNVIGSRGSVIPIFRDQIRRGGPVTVSHPDATRYFMSIPEAALLVINAMSFAKGGEIFILEMGEQHRIDDIAKKMIDYYHPERNTAIPVVYTGLPPCEKIHEELMYSFEKKIPSINKSISQIENCIIERSAMVTSSTIIEKFREIEKMNSKEIRSILSELTGGAIQH